MTVEHSASTPLHCVCAANHGAARSMNAGLHIPSGPAQTRQQAAGGAPAIAAAGSACSKVGETLYNKSA